MDSKSAIVIICALWLCAQMAMSQTELSIVGKVCDSKTNEPLPFVNVSVKGTINGTVSGFDGIFSLSVSKGSTVAISYVGYDPYEFKAKERLTDTIYIDLNPSEMVLEELHVTPGVNPAYAILDSIVANRGSNDLQQQPFWKRDIYNKIEIDLKNLKRSEKERKWMKQFEFIYNYIDTLAGSNETFLPIFFSENLSSVVHKNGVGDAEKIIATNTSGIKHPMVAEFTSSLYLDINPYDNFFSISDLTFISPINGQGKFYYRYYVRDSINAPTGKQYLVSFIPRKEEDRVFKGTMLVDKNTWAITHIDMKLSEKANVNFMSQLSVTKEFALDNNNRWLLQNDSVYTEINVQKKSNGKQIGLIGRKSTWYTNYSLKENADEKIKYGQVIVAADAFENDADFWVDARPEPLEEYEETVFLLADSISNIPLFNSVTEYLRVLFFGYKDIGLVELGPYFYFYSKNKIEGHRFRIGARSTTDLFEHLRLKGYVAYGTKDQKFKYGGGGDYFFSKEPLLSIGANYFNDYQLLGKSDNAFNEDNILTSLLSKELMSKLNRMEQTSVRFRSDVTTWFNFELSAKYEKITASPYVPFSNGDIKLDQFESFAAKTKLKFAPGQEIVLDTYESIRFPGRFPVVFIGAEMGQVKFGTQTENYHKLTFNLTDKLPINPIGFTRLHLQAGKVWGDVPFPYLKLHEGNETYAFDPYAFSLMNYHEYLSDKYAGISVEHHFMGFFFNRIPLLARLNWREVAGISAIYGAYNNQRNHLFMTDAMTELPTGGYAEWHVGVENIFRLLRLNATWRLTDADNKNDFAVMAVLQFTF